VAVRGDIELRWRSRATPRQSASDTHLIRRKARALATHRSRCGLRFGRRKLAADRNDLFGMGRLCYRDSHQPPKPSA